jgi:hypothetical protein
MHFDQYYERTHDNSILFIRTYSMNDWEGEFAFCEVFCEALVVGVL